MFSFFLSFLFFNFFVYVVTLLVLIVMTVIITTAAPFLKDQGGHFEKFWIGFVQLGRPLRLIEGLFQSLSDRRSTIIVEQRC